MAQNSKKDQIAQAALPLFLEHGIKGTSVDMVVKASGVSKPTVYNHFQDKSYLLAYVIDCWLQAQPTPAFQARTEKDLILEMDQHWLSAEACRLYGLCLGEGERAPGAVQIFLEGYDQPWRAALEEQGRKLNLSTDWLQASASHRLLRRLTARCTPYSKPH
ncbi:TetR/AcrR family transcriptional regulator [Nitrincola alkalisediminis]|uniref:TetR/AcrR family transcriptional regulator n=1 Tax=Nitrincola alkalisediminis TaxID=1366656 RepID=UPI001875654C|nr:TetR/AcrR family transcriptional regulator [Nitrincola alkalisediminis]